MFVPFARAVGTKEESMNHSLRRRALTASIALSVATVGAVVGSNGVSADQSSAPGQAAAGDRPEATPVVESTSGSYIVLLDGEPLLAEFGQDGLDTAAARTQAQELTAEQGQLMAEVGIDANEQLASYTNALNGFAAIMTLDQAEKLSSKAGVSAVYPNELQQPTTDASGDFLGLSGDAGVWATQATGDGVLVGIIDSGIWPEHPSVDPAGFAGSDSGYRLEPIVDPDAGIDSTGCDFGTTTHDLAPGFYDDAFSCNAKLIGARHIMPAYLALTGLTDVEYDSARDEDGHGTHTATTAAGNAGVIASVLGVERGTVSGIAPDAQIAVYKALGELGGYGSDLALAIDVAVSDGVDVINYSIGSSSFAIGPDDVAFLFATLAGVHVATSNGNSGPGAATIGSPASVPWLTSVGASTHDRTFLGSVTIAREKEDFSKKKKKAYDKHGESKSGWHKSSKKGDDDDHDDDHGDDHDDPAPLTATGVSITGGTKARPIVDAADLGNELCLSNVPFTGKVKGKIVLCKRGTNARIDKSYAVYLAGGAGMVLYNTFDADTQITDSHWVPSVHLNFTDGSAIKAYIHSVEKPYAQITGGEKAATQGSVMAAFSSRGENRLTADLIKPDVTAPGVNILAGATPTPTSGPAGQLFQSISGTSMSSPHVAGLMALITEVHPDWSPGMVKSALMTTSRQDVTKEDGTTPADPFDMGAGHVNPPSMFDPGIVFDTTIVDYVGAICSFGLDFLLRSPCSAYYAAWGATPDMSEYNQASIASGSVPGSQTISRTATNVTDRDLTLTPSFAIAGVSAIASPASAVVAPGDSVTFDITFAVTTAPLNEWAFGSMTMGDGSFSSYSPIALRPVKLGVPDEVSGTIAAGGTSFGVDFGYSGDYMAAGHGLVPADLRIDTVDQDPDSTFSPSDVGNGATAHTVDVTAGNALLRIHIPPVANPDTDLDLYVYDPAGNLVGISGNGGTNETVDILFPDAGQWTFYVHGWAAGPATAYVAEVYQVSATPGGNMVVDGPAAAAVGTTGTINVSWPTDLPAGPYLGAVSHTSADGLEALTLISVNG
jgi:subtilisin family serine protease